MPNLWQPQGQAQHPARQFFEAASCGTLVVKLCGERLDHGLYFREAGALRRVWVHARIGQRLHDSNPARVISLAPGP